MRTSINTMLRSLCISGGSSSSRFSKTKSALLARGRSVATGAAILSGCMAFVGSVPEAHGAITEQVTNGSFENNNGFNGNNSGLGWETVEGEDLTLGFDVYSHTTQVYYAGPAPVGAGDFYFHTVGLGTLDTTPVVVEQVIDLTSEVGKNFRVGAFISGFGAGGDTATIDLSFWDAAGGASGAGNQIGTTLTVDGTTGGADGITNTWDLISEIGQVPAGTVSASVRINQATAGGSNGNDNYVDLVSLATLDGSFSILNLEINKSSGAASIFMPSDAEEGSRNINFYEIISPNSDLLDTGGWQPLDGNLAGDILDSTDWTEGGGSDARLLTEANLEGDTEFAAAGLNASLGSIYTGGIGGAEDLIFNYALADGTIVQGTVSYVGLVGVDGDYSGNGVVDAADYAIWRETLGSTVDLRADGSGNGTVGSEDYDYWKTRFGNTSNPGAIAGVPEPSTFVLIVGLTGLLLTAGRSRVNS